MKHEVSFTINFIADNDLCHAALSNQLTVIFNNSIIKSTYARYYQNNVIKSIAVTMITILNNTEIVTAINETIDNVDIVSINNTFYFYF